jgi:hypothetical protein
VYAADLFADDRGERTIAAVFQADDLAPRIDIRAGFGADHDDAVGCGRGIGSVQGRVTMEE